jgi:hypothetical protein
MKYVLVFLASFLLTGCVSKIILHPGISGRFVEEESGKPIVGTRVSYTNTGDKFSRETITDLNGAFSFPADFVDGYTGFPTVAIGLQAEIILMARPEFNWSGLYQVKNSSVDKAVIDTGIIKVNSLFLIPLSNKKSNSKS